MCLSCLLATGRYGELLDLLELPRYPSWHYRRYGVEALLAMGRKAEAVQYAEASRGRPGVNLIRFHGVSSQTASTGCL
jgi:hypothetical protein